MVDRDDIGSWLAGPGTQVDEGYAGDRLGLPQDGPGSVARLSRRIPALLIDWGLCQLIAAAFLGYRFGHGGASSFGPLAVFFLENLLLVGTLGSTVGHRLLGLRVVPLGGAYAGPGRALLRTALLCLVIPAVIWDRDSRGMHDRLAGTVIVRSR